MKKIVKVVNFVVVEGLKPLYVSTPHYLNHNMNAETLLGIFIVS